ncbi:hypothetical protein M0R45_007510 [Rubus argutus]|uniref:Uncharacterized protein n=1 Tax=Rubus argutus TaxID=59490 RepID=A0AAW1Y006_RUBAR
MAVAVWRYGEPELGFLGIDGEMVVRPRRRGRLGEVVCWSVICWQRRQWAACDSDGWSEDMCGLIWGWALVFCGLAGLALQKKCTGCLIEWVRDSDEEAVVVEMCCGGDTVSLLVLLMA